MLAAWSAGFWSGRHTRHEGGGRLAGKFEDAIIAILGLLLAFTFSMALAKYDHRRETLTADSNAIGDFYTCASLLNDPVRTKLQGVIRGYTRLRVDLARQGRSGEDVAAALAAFPKLHGEMTSLVGEAIAGGTPIAVPLTNTLNNLTSAHAARLVAVRDRLPESVVLLIFFAGAISTMLVGREQGSSEKPLLAGTMSFLLLVTLVVFVILDLNDPVKGLITVNQEPMRRVLESMGK
jgi:hypothetical protein